MKDRNLIQVFRTFVEKERLFTPYDRLLVAVSGGLDSTTLAHLLHREGYTIAVAHCNFQLRGEDSDKDENSVKQLAAELGVPYHGKRIDLTTESSTNENTQITARRTRYLYFKKILDEYNYQFLITAHHLQDSLETMLINLLRGTGYSGLTGIRPINGLIVRPLLTATRQDILDFANAHGLTWREDASNKSDAYLRNRIRHAIVPKMKELGLQAAPLVRSLSRMRAEHTLLQAGYDSWREKIVSQLGDRTIVDRIQLSLESEEVALLLLREFSPYQDFTDDQYRQMIATPGRRSLKSESGLAEISPEQIVFIKRPVVSEMTIHLVDRLPFTYQFGDLAYCIEEVDRPANLRTDGTSYLRITDLPLHLRPRKNGDRFSPLGMRGKSKKVKALLNDLKLSAREKGELLLLTSASDEIMAVAHLRTAENFSVGPADHRVISLTVTRKSPDPH